MIIFKSVIPFIISIFLFSSFVNAQFLNGLGSAENPYYSWIYGGNINFTLQNITVFDHVYEWNGTAYSDLDLAGYDITNGETINANEYCIGADCILVWPNQYNSSYEWFLNQTIFDMYNSSYLTNSYNATYDAKPDNTYNSTYDAKPSNTYNVTYHNKISYNTSWTEDHANTLYAQIGVGGNTSFNETLTGTLYYPLNLNPGNYLTDSYNSTYDGLIIWGYNQTKPSIDYCDNLFLPLTDQRFNETTWVLNQNYLTNSYNATYDAKPNNIYNASYEWFLNSTIFEKYNSSYLTSSYNVTYHGLIGSIKSGSNVSSTTCGAGNHISAINNQTGVVTCSADSGGGSADYTNIVYTNKTNFITQPQIINSTLNVNNGTNILYRCTVAGVIPIGGLTIATNNCGTFLGNNYTDTIGDASGRDNNDAILLAYGITASQSGTLKAIGINMEAATGGKVLMVALYNDTGGLPNGLKANSTNTTYTTGFNNVSVNDYQIVAGTKYWITLRTQYADWYKAKTSDGTGALQYATYAYGPFPAIYPTPTSNPERANMYMIYTNGSGAATYVDTGLRVS